MSRMIELDSRLTFRLSAWTLTFILSLLDSALAGLVFTKRLAIESAAIIASAIHGSIYNNIRFSWFDLFDLVCMTCIVPLPLVVNIYYEAFHKNQHP